MYGCFVFVSSFENATCFITASNGKNCFLYFRPYSWWPLIVFRRRLSRCSTIASDRSSAVSTRTYSSTTTCRACSGATGRGRCGCETARTTFPVSRSRSWNRRRACAPRARRRAPRSVCAADSRAASTAVATARHVVSFGRRAVSRTRVVCRVRPSYARVNSGYWRVNRSTHETVQCTGQFARNQAVHRSTVDNNQHRLDTTRVWARVTLRAG